MIWFFTLSIISVILAFLFPENDVNGTSGKIIAGLYIFDVILALMCELLTSKQSKWSFFIYCFVEIAEIAILIILKTRFATLATSIFVWFPLHIVSFVIWHKHPDKMKKELTEVRSLKKWQTTIIIIASAIWTFVVGYLVAKFSPETDFYSNVKTIKIIAYFDACISVVQIINAILLMFRFKENWIVWYLSIALETVVNIISGQWILLVLKVGYLSNTTYGLLTWSSYIKKHDKSTLINKRKRAESQFEKQSKSLPRLNSQNHIYHKHDINKNAKLLPRLKKDNKFLRFHQ